MDRLHVVIIASVLLAGSALLACGDGEPAAPPPSRVITVAAAPTAEVDLEEFCDVGGAGGEGREMSFPELAGAAPAEAEGPRWVNVWATWCAPCVEEIPRLLAFRDRLAEGGTPVELVLLSADTNDEAVAAFRREHRFMPAGPRVADPAALPEWAASLGLDEGAPLPMHIFVNDRGRVVCARTGGIDDDDFAAVEAIMTR